jgi:hypothetical protein
MGFSLQFIGGQENQAAEFPLSEQGPWRLVDEKQAVDRK